MPIICQDFVRNYTVTNFYYGFFLDHSSDNTLQDNTASNNVHTGFSLWDSSGNTIFHNNIIDNAVQAYDDNPAANDWHHPDLLEGNYWSDYPGVDGTSIWQTPLLNSPTLLLRLIGLIWAYFS